MNNRKYYNGNGYTEICYFCRKSFYVMGYEIDRRPICNTCLLSIPSKMRIINMNKNQYNDINSKCEICKWDKSRCDVHHIIPKSLGGGDNEDNFITLCPNCHRLVHTFKYKIDWNTKRFIKIL